MTPQPVSRSASVAGEGAKAILRIAASRLAAGNALRGAVISGPVHDLGVRQRINRAPELRERAALLLQILDLLTSDGDRVCDMTTAVAVLNVTRPTILKALGLAEEAGILQRQMVLLPGGARQRNWFRFLPKSGGQAMDVAQAPPPVQHILDLGTAAGPLLADSSDGFPLHAEQTSLAACIAGFRTAKHGDVKAADGLPRTFDVLVRGRRAQLVVQSSVGIPVAAIQDFRVLAAMLTMIVHSNRRQTSLRNPFRIAVNDLLTVLGKGKSQANKIYVANAIARLEHTRFRLLQVMGSRPVPGVSDRHPSLVSSETFRFILQSASYFAGKSREVGRDNANLAGMVSAGSLVPVAFDVMLPESVFSLVHGSDLSSIIKLDRDGFLGESHPLRLKLYAWARVTIYAYNTSDNPLIMTWAELRMSIEPSRAMTAFRRAFRRVLAEDRVKGEGYSDVQGIGVIETVPGSGDHEQSMLHLWDTRLRGKRARDI